MRKRYIGRGCRRMAAFLIAIRDNSLQRTTTFTFVTEMILVLECHRARASIALLVRQRHHPFLDRR
jgi:hypothetical protein